MSTENPEAGNPASPQVPQAGDSLDGMVRPFLVRPADHTFTMKNPCPYCGGKITFRATGWVQEDDGTWAADMGDMECSSEPPIDSDEWEQWNAEHGAHDYNDAWHSRHEAIIAALHRRVRFPLDDNRSNVPDEVSLLASGTQACSAGDVPEVPKAQGLAPSVCSHF